ncbi:hypothetical protein L1987_11102 [Smallanthus sonchifolius]|uniref:Uncharacterized protein n=1 Tax=Smallanthus sonchifolius TaxID=185202 RepID=A0ACB9JA19_9ASTR|nr:hypothetical protein L1987_11102 [Smallanthus sonchifolius]
MGACLSSTAESIDKSSYAFVISIKGELRDYPTPILVSEVLQFEKPSCFLCNSDCLHYDQHIPALDSEHELEAGQIYFILPNTMLGRLLSASDMAALAVKASVALDSNSKSQKMKKNKGRVSPLVLMGTTRIDVEVEEEDVNKVQRRNGGLRVTRSGSIRKRPRRYNSSKKGLLAVRSFRIRLSTIHENEGWDELQV